MLFLFFGIYGYFELVEMTVELCRINQLVSN